MSTTKLNIVTFRFAICVTVWLSLTVLSGCDSQEVNESPSESYLLPQLQSQRISSIKLTSPEGTTRLRLREDGWWVDHPMDFPADENVINNFVQSVMDAEIGKEIKVAQADIAQLGVDEQSGLKVKLGFNDGKSVALIFGNTHVPKNTNDALMMGASAIANRYIRVVDKSDQVFQVPLSLIDLTSLSSLWTSREFVRIPSPARITFYNGDNRILDLTREHMFANIYLAGSGRKASPDIALCMESFLRSGYVSMVSNVNQKLTQGYPHPSSSMVVKDFLGAEYRFSFGTPIQPSEAMSDRAHKQASFMDDGQASALVPFTLSVNSRSQVLNPLETNLSKRNLAVAQLYQDRLGYLTYEEFLCVQPHFDEVARND